MAHVLETIGPITPSPLAPPLPPAPPPPPPASPPPVARWGSASHSYIAISGDGRTATKGSYSHSHGYWGQCAKTDYELNTVTDRVAIDLQCGSTQYHEIIGLVTTSGASAETSMSGLGLTFGFAHWDGAFGGNTWDSGHVLTLEVDGPANTLCLYRNNVQMKCKTIEGAPPPPYRSPLSQPDRNVPDARLPVPFSVDPASIPRRSHPRPRAQAARISSVSACTRTKGGRRAGPL